MLIADDERLSPMPGKASVRAGSVRSGVGGADIIGLERGLFSAVFSLDEEIESVSGRKTPNNAYQ